MESRIYYKGDIKKVAQNINFIFKKFHEGYYSIKEGRIQDNYPIDFPYGFAEVVVSKDEKFCVQRLYLKEEANEYEYLGEYKGTYEGSIINQFGQSGDSIPTPSEKRKNVLKAGCYTRSGMIKNNIVKWGRWARIYNFAPIKEMEDSLIWASANLVEKFRDSYMGNYAADYREMKYKIPSLEFLSQAREFAPATNSAYGYNNLYDTFLKEMPEDFTFRYLGQVEDLMDKPEGPERWTFLHNKLGKENFFNNNSSIFISGYFIKKPGVAIDIPNTDKDAWGILKVFSYPMYYYKDQVDFEHIFHPSQRNVFNAPVERAINRREYDNNQDARNGFKNNRLSRMYIYEQLYPKKLMNQYIWDVNNSPHGTKYPLDKMPVPKLMMTGRPFNPSTGDAINENLNPVGWYDILRATKRDWSF